ncbi:MAG: GNAT family N-acetyltransferase [Cyanobacteria bacterium P01_D01_bin.105]
MVAQLEHSTGSLAITQGATQHAKNKNTTQPAKPSTALTKQQQKEAATVLGQAFDKYPFMSYVLPDATTRVQKLTKLFLPLIRSSCRHGSVIIAPGDGGVLTWVPGSVFSGREKFLDLFRSGMLGVPLSLGLSAFKRLIVHDEVCEVALLQHAPQDFAYIWAVGVRPDQAGKGLGSKMVRAALDEMRQQGYSTCWLRTETSKNVGLYEHLGFKQVLTDILSGSQQQYWLMFQNL